METIRRIVPMTEPFMSYKANDLFYAKLLSVANFEPKSRTLFVDYDDYINQYQEELKQIIGCKRTTLYDYLKYFLKVGLISFGEVKWSGTMRKSIILETKNLDKYIIIDTDVIDYILTTKSKNSIKLYVYLLNKTNFFTDKGMPCEFSILELSQALGYNNRNREPSTSVSKLIQYVLDDLERTGLLETAIVIKPSKSGKYPVRRYRIIHMAEHINELKKIDRKLINEYHEN